jgi:hypothetical protein
VRKLISAAAVAATAALLFAVNAGAAPLPSVTGSGTVDEYGEAQLPIDFSIDASGVGLSATGTMQFVFHNHLFGDQVTSGHVVCLGASLHFAEVVAQIDSAPAGSTAPYMLFYVNDTPGSFIAMFGGWAPTEGCGIPVNGLPLYPLLSGSLTIAGGDPTPPQVASNVTGTLGANGWYTSDVHVGWDISDPESFIVAKRGCAAADVTADTPGETFSCDAWSPGGKSSQTVTVKRDATPPVVTFSGNQGTYAITDTVSITCSAADALSGLASTTCQDVSEPAWQFGSGTTLSATATDVAGNVGSGSTTFEVIVTPASLETLIGELVGDSGIANSLIAKIKAGTLAAFDHEVDAQTGKKISASDAALLKQLAAAL